MQRIFISKKYTLSKNFVQGLFHRIEKYAYLIPTNSWLFFQNGGQIQIWIDVHVHVFLKGFFLHVNSIWIKIWFDKNNQTNNYMYKSINSIESLEQFIYFFWQIKYCLKIRAN